jgi:sodium transport system permease protein
LEIYPAVITSEHNDSVKTGTVIVNYSSKKDKQSIQAGAFMKSLMKVKRNIAENRYEEIGVREYFKASAPELKNTATPEIMRNSKNAGVLPITIIIILVLGTFVISNYVILGEKDNNTLESLLSSGINRRDIIYGKMSIVMLAGLIMSALELVSFFFYGRFTGSLNFDVVIDSAQTASLIPVLLSLSLLISSLSVFVSCRLKSSSSGQLIFLPVMITYLLLGLMGTFEGIEIKRGLLLIPVLNSAGVLKAVLKGDPDIFNTVFVVFLNLGYSFFVIKSASGYLNGEDILEKNTDFDIAKKGFSKGASFTVFGLLVVAYMLIGGYLQGKEIVSGLVYSQVLILGGFAVVMKRVLDKPFVEILRIKKFPPVFVPAAVILGLISRYPISLVSEQLLEVFPVPDIMKKTDIMSTGIGNLSVFSAVMIIAVLPAIFEEFTFRGVFFEMMEKKFTRTSLILITGLMFGAMHMNIFTMFETGVLGIVMGLLTVYSGSIIPAIIMHFTNNFYSVIVMFMLRNGTVTEDNFMFSSIPFAWVMTLAAFMTVYFVIFRQKA